MEEYNVLVLMAKDKETGFLTETVDSYTIEADMALIESIYLAEEQEDFYIYLTITTTDVEDWEYYGIYDLYDEEIYEELGIEVLDGSGEYNPRWILRLRYSKERPEVEELLNRIMKLHRAELARIAPLITENKEKYMAEAGDE